MENEASSINEKLNAFISRNNLILVFFMIVRYIGDGLGSTA